MFYRRPEVLDLLAANNLKFVVDENNKPVLDTSGKAGMLSVANTEPENYTPEALYAALQGAERAEKDFIKTGKRSLETDTKAKDSDYQLARLVATHLTGESLKRLAARGLHGRHAGDRARMEAAVTDLLYKGSFNRDLYTNTYIGNMPTQQGHTTANSLGGVELRPELAAINTSLKDTEGPERLEAIRRKRMQLNAMAAIQNNPELLKDPDVVKYVMGDKTFMNDLLSKAQNYGFNVGDASTIAGAGKDAVSGGRVAVKAEPGSKVYIHTNGNGKNGRAKMQEAFSKSNGK